ncbi:MAG: aspartate 1-decarboxylase [Anaerolineae bacterium]|nr:aspartate 1-decarboxylase [Anaerolineae bacterium]
MFVSMLKAKLHRACVTGADLNYVGSITIAVDLLEQVGMYAYEKVLVVNIENGARFETYIIPGDRGSGVIQLNGAAARLVSIGDRVIVMAFAQVPAPPPADWQPCVLVLDEQNRVASIELEGNVRN